MKNQEIMTVEELQTILKVILQDELIASVNEVENKLEIEFENKQKFTLYIKEN